LILTDNSQKSESLAIELLKNSNKVIHLPMAQDHFLEVWQQTIFARQKLNYCSVEASLVTGLIIVQENLFCQILQKTLGITIPLETANHLSVIHYPQANRQSILQALLPIDRQLVTQLSKDKICIA
jgi:probable phosphoglycerate mutase